MTNLMLLESVTPELLGELISESVKTQFEKFKKNFIPNHSDELLTRDEACQFLKIDSSTLWHWTKKEKVIAYGIANRRYYKKAELLACLKPLNK